jgi:hypothetical protein
VPPGGWRLVGIEFSLCSSSRHEQQTRAKTAGGVRRAGTGWEGKRKRRQDGDEECPTSKLVFLTTSHFRGRVCFSGAHSSPAGACDSSSSSPSHSSACSRPITVFSSGDIGIVALQAAPPVQLTQQQALPHARPGYHHWKLRRARPSQFRPAWVSPGPSWELDVDRRQGRRRFTESMAYRV